jgi:hypothetical protein
MKASQSKRATLRRQQAKRARKRQPAHRHHGGQHEHTCRHIDAVKTMLAVESPDARPTTNEILTLHADAAGAHFQEMQDAPTRYVLSNNLLTTLAASRIGRAVELGDLPASTFAIVGEDSHLVSVAEIVKGDKDTYKVPGYTDLSCLGIFLDCSDPSEIRFGAEFDIALPGRHSKVIFESILPKHGSEPLHHVTDPYYIREQNIDPNIDDIVDTLGIAAFATIGRFLKILRNPSHISHQRPDGTIAISLPDNADLPRVLEDPPLPNGAKHGRVQ